LVQRGLLFLLFPICSNLLDDDIQNPDAYEDE
jgi:hypothetical protein